MSFKCSVFGHAFGDSEIERDREEEGSEVVTTIRELQTCKRCGETRVVSENKEVTTLETAADIVAEDLDAGDDAAEPAAPADDSPAGESPVESQPDDPDDTAIVDAETGEQTAVGAGGGADTQPDTPDTPDVDAEEDDGVILDEDDEEETPERAPGEWPEEPDDGDDDWRPETDIEPDPEVQVEPTASAVTVPEGEFHCPECGFTTPVEESSLRQGDFCPECHRGSLEHGTE
jgi:ssDNA-binding Zn-finger/Zn-ribbon topoisomerase 1